MENGEVLTGVLQVLSILLNFAVLAVLIEAIVESVKWVIEDGWNRSRIIAFVIAVVVAVLSQLDLFETLSIPLLVPYIGSFFTGVMMGRGATVFHDLLLKITSIAKSG